MFDFLDSDWFNITLQIVFILLIWFDIKKYRQTKKKEYIVNIVATIGFAIWVLYPYYISYFEWSEAQKNTLLKTCKQENNATLCRCVKKSIYEHYSYKEYLQKKRTEELERFIQDAKEECSDDGWF